MKRTNKECRQQPDLFDTTAPYQPHSGTSREAAKEIEDSITELQRTVLDCLKACGPKRGATDYEIQRMTGMNENTERPRRIELVAKGLVDPLHYGTGEPVTRKTGTGRKAQVWVYRPF